MSEQIKNLIKKIQHLYEVDIGDFKRQIISSLNRFEEELSNDLTFYGEAPQPGHKITSKKTSISMEEKKNQPENLNQINVKVFLKEIKNSVICNNTTEIESVRTQVLTQLHSIIK